VQLGSTRRTTRRIAPDVHGRKRGARTRSRELFKATKALRLRFAKRTSRLAHINKRLSKGLLGEKEKCYIGSRPSKTGRKRLEKSSATSNRCSLSEGGLGKLNPQGGVARASEVGGRTEVSYKSRGFVTGRHRVTNKHTTWEENGFTKGLLPTKKCIAEGKLKNAPARPTRHDGVSRLPAHQPSAKKKLLSWNLWAEEFS